MEVKSAGFFREMDFTIMGQAIVSCSNVSEVFGYELTIKPGHGGSAKDIIARARDAEDMVDLDIAIAKAIAGLEKRLPLSKPINVWINLFPSTLLSMTAIGKIRNLIAKSRHNVYIEITEHEIIRDYETVIASLNTLREAGAKIVLDDFGAGASSLTTLMKIELDAIKIDNQVFQKCSKYRHFLPMLEGLVQTASNINCPIVAEGIETQAQLDLARELGIDFVQGYLIHTPRDILRYSAEVSVRRHQSVAGSTIRSLRAPSKEVLAVVNGT